MTGSDLLIVARVVIILRDFVVCMCVGDFTAVLVKREDA